MHSETLPWCLCIRYFCGLETVGLGNTIGCDVMQPLYVCGGKVTTIYGSLFNTSVKTGGLGK